MRDYTFPTAVVTLTNETLEVFLKEDEKKGDLLWTHGSIGQFLLEMSREDETVQKGFKDVLTAFVIKGDYIHRPHMRTKTLWEKTIREKLRWRLSRGLSGEIHEDVEVENIVSLMGDVYDAASRYQRMWFFIDWEEESPVIQKATGSYLSTLWLLLDEAPPNGNVNPYADWMNDWNERPYYKEQAERTLVQQEGWQGLDFDTSMNQALEVLTAISVLEEKHHADLKDMFRSVYESAKKKHLQA